MNYFDNTLIVIYPFIPFVIRDSNHFEGIKFRNLNIRHLTQYKDVKKPREPLISFLENLRKNMVTDDGKYILALGYSVHHYSGGITAKESLMNRLKTNIEYLYYLFERNRTLNLSYPKFYLVDNIRVFDDGDFQYGFEITEELQDKQYQMIYKDIEKNNYKITLKLKYENFIQDIPNSPFANYLKRVSNTSTSLYRGIFWINRSRDTQRTNIERVLASVIAIENLLGFKRLRSEDFAERIIEKLTKNITFTQIEKQRLTFLKSTLIQAYDVRSGIVHGRKIFDAVEQDRYARKNIDLKVNIEGYRYYHLNYVIEEIFDLLLLQKVSSDSISQEIKIGNFVENLFPNRLAMNDIIQKIEKEKTESNLEGYILIGRILNKLKRNDVIGLDSVKLGQIINFVNNCNSTLKDNGIEIPIIDNLGNLRRHDYSFKQLRDIINKIELFDKNNFFSSTVIYKKKDVELSTANQGLIIFLELLSYYVILNRN